MALLTPFQAQPDHLSGLYSFVDTQRIQRFLEAHPYLGEVLSAAAAPLRQAFPDARFTLGVSAVSNPDSGERQVYLLVAIWTAAEPPEALDRLHRFYDDWWLDHQSVARGHLCFEVAFE